MSPEYIRRPWAEQQLYNSDLEFKRKQVDSWSKELSRLKTPIELDTLKLDKENNKVRQ